MNHVKYYLTKFNFTGAILQATVDWDSHPDVSPPSSPTPTDHNGLCSLSDLSPLTTPPSSPPTAASPLPPFPVSQTFKPLEDLEDVQPLEFSDNEMEFDEARAEGGSERVQPGTSNSVATSQIAKIKARQCLHSRSHQKKVRARNREAGNYHYTARKCPHKKYVEGAASIECSLETKKLKVASLVYIAQDECGRSKKVHLLSEVTGKGLKYNFRLINWDGSTMASILDKCRCIVRILAGHPNSSDWPSAHANAAEAIESQRSRVHVPKKNCKHHRRAFVALRCGVSHGSGQRRPSNLSNEPTNAGILDWLNNLEPFKRIASFTSLVLATWAPKLHEYYMQTVDALHANDPFLQCIFPGGIFSMATYNLGPRTVCFKHKDFANLPFSFCAITALGNFDPSKGGHLILWDLELVIKFPPGSTILILSAIIAHSNTAITKHETCYSFTQYTAGAMFRWVDNKFAVQDTHLSTLTAKELEIKQRKNEARWTHGLSLLPTVPESVSVEEL